MTEQIYVFFFNRFIKSNLVILFIEFHYVFAYFWLLVLLNFGIVTKMFLLFHIYYILIAFMVVFVLIC